MVVSRKLKIVMTVDPEIPVPPFQYGGIERIVHLLVGQLMIRGHEIHLFCNQNSTTPATLIPYKAFRSRSFLDTARNALAIGNYLRKKWPFDIIHSFGRLAYLLPVMNFPIPKVQSYQRHVTPRSVKWGRLVFGRRLAFAACSRYCALTSGSDIKAWTIIPNGVQIETYQFSPNVAQDAPFVFLGRIEHIKGVHHAIQVAKRTGKKLIIAGNHSESGPHYDYFKKEVVPHCDGEQIQYVGPVDDAQKNVLLGSASALLFPIEWGEPFGIVMVEALACGTPVIAFRKGAVPEVISHGETGFICDSFEQFVDATHHISSINRLKCRQSAEEYFSDRVIADLYETLYYSLVKR